jgi:hypothetical protein
MTVQQLVEALQRAGRPDAEVCVDVPKGRLSSATGEPVTRVYNSFDGEVGKLMLCTDSPLIRESPDTCRRCGMYGVKAASRISSRVSYVNMDTGDMEVAVYLDDKKQFSVPFNTRREMRGKEDK